MPAVDALRDWRQLGRSLELAQGFAYYLVFTNWPEQNQAGKALLNEALQTRGLSLQVVVPDDPTRLVETAIAALFRTDLPPDLPPNSPLWLECWRNGGAPDWNLARRKLMARLNEGRSRLEKEVLRPLILLLPRDGVQRAAEDAPDMWSIRKLVLHLERPAPTEVLLEPFYEREFAEPPTPEHLARAERKLAAWQKQWAKAEAVGDMHILSLPDAWGATETLLEVGRLQDAQTVAGQALIASRVRRDDNQPHTLRELRISLDNVGRVSRDLGNLEATRAAYGESLMLIRQLRAAQGDTPQVLFDLANTLNLMGKFLSESSDLEAAREVFMESRQLGYRLQQFDAYAHMASNYILPISLKNVGWINLVMGDIQAARSAFSEEVQLARMALQSTGDTSSCIRNLYMALDNLGHTYRYLGDVEAAQSRYLEGLELSRRFQKVMGDLPIVLHDLALSLYYVGSSYGDIGSFAEARTAFQEGADLAARLVALQPDHPGYQKLQAQFQAELDKLEHPE